MSSKSVTPNPADPFEFRRPPLPSQAHRHSGKSGFSDQLDGSTINRLARAIGAPAVGVSAVLLITEIYRHMPLANVTTVGFTFLLAILIASTIGGLRTAIPMSVVATLAFDFYFIPPVDTWNITDPQDWVALSAFIVTSVVGSSLSAWARRQTKEAHWQRTEAEQLYDLSQRLLSA
jgi:K+-sensing histidine kinase KdpD